MNDCKRQGKWFGGCKFSPRYDLDESNTPEMKFVTIGRGTLAQIVEAYRKKTYVMDVCETCGRAVKRLDSTDPDRA